MARTDYTVKELAAAAGLNPSRIRQILNETNSPLVGDKRAGGWFITRISAERWLASREK